MTEDLLGPTTINRFLSVIYGSVVFLRNSLYDVGLLHSYTSSLPVFSVGNVTVGGSGKTPVTAYLCGKLRGRGFRPVILSRGYGGRLQGPHRVQESDLPVDVGDEPLLHHLLGAEVVVSRDRVSGAKFIEREGLGDCILLDDGFQHRALSRQLNLLLVDESEGGIQEQLREGRLLPAGRFRESLSRALRRTDSVILVRRDRQPFSDGELPVPVVRVRLAPGSVTDLYSGESRSLSSFSGSRAGAITGIAKAEPFFQFLRDAGVELEFARSFGDHFSFQGSEIGEGALPVFVTEKDAVKLSKSVHAAGRCYVLKLECVVVSGEEMLLSRISEVVSQGR